MKKILSVLIVVAIVVAACSKANKLNRRIDGEWDVVTMDGTALPSGTTIVLKFDKDKKGKGAYTVTTSASGISDVESGSYELVDDTQIIMTETGSTDKDTSNVKDYSKTDMTMTDTDGTYPIVLKKKD